MICCRAAERDHVSMKRLKCRDDASDGHQSKAKQSQLMKFIQAGLTQRAQATYEENHSEQEDR